MRWRRAFLAAWRAFQRELAAPQPVESAPMTFEDAARRLNTRMLVEAAVDRGADIAAGRDVAVNEQRLAAVRHVLQERELAAHDPPVSSRREV